MAMLSNAQSPPQDCKIIFRPYRQKSMEEKYLISLRKPLLKPAISSKTFKSI